MHHTALVIAVLSLMLILSVYSSSFTFLLVEGVIDGNITCNPQGDGKTYCCADIFDKDGYHTTTYCTTCDDTNPPSNCTKRERPLTVNPSNDLSNILEGGVLEQPSTNQKLNKDVAPGTAEIIEEPKIDKNKDDNIFQDKEGLLANRTDNTIEKQK
jgi:hypothetical protein